jgi:hypothetical protein
VRARAANAEKQGPPFPKAQWHLLLQDAEPVGLSVFGPKLGPAEIGSVSNRLGKALNTGIITFGAKSVSLRKYIDGARLFVGRPKVLPDPDVAGCPDMPQNLARALIPSETLLFRDEGDDGYQQQIEPSSRIEIGAGFYELRLDEAGPEGWGDALYHFNAGTPDGDARLHFHGVIAVNKPVAEFLGGLTLIQGENWLLQTVGRPVYVRACSSALDIHFENGDGSLVWAGKLPVAKWSCINLSEGNWRLKLLEKGRESIFRLDFREVDPPEAVRVCIQPEGLDLDEFASGAAAVEIASPAAIQNAMLYLSIETVGGMIAQAEVLLDSLPAVIGLDGDAFQSVRNAASLLAKAGTPARVLISLSGIATHEQVIRPRFWRWRLEEGNLLWHGPNGEIATALISDPTVDPLKFTPASGAKKPKTLLVVPKIDGDSGMFSGVLLTNIVGLRPGDFVEKSMKPFTRSLEGFGNESGLRAGFDALVTWRTATTTNIFGTTIQGVASQVVEDQIVRAICGENWLKCERQQRMLSGNFYRRLVQIACLRHLAMGGDAFDPLKPEFEPRLKEHLEKQFRIALPDPSIIVFPQSEYWPELDDAVNAAWDAMAVDIRSQGGEPPDGDAGAGDREWQKAVEHAREAVKMRPLLNMLVPKERAQQLEYFDYEHATFDDLVREVEACHIDIARSGGRWIIPADFKALFRLFLSPARLAEDPDWRIRLERFASDRFAARAVRYSAVRYLELRRQAAI